ncbi:MAG: sialate O-acetylesterase [Sedimentisphaerales bacterium]
MCRKQFVFLALVLFASAAYAEIKLPAIISDNMVLQAQTKVPIWGWAEAQSEIKVTCSWSPTEYTAHSDSNGRWLVKVDTPKSGGKYEITITCGQESKTINNILIGEVWLCSGQSNMEWLVMQANNAEKEISEATYPDIRLFKVQEGTSKEPVDDCNGQWKVCSPKSAAKFSAVGYFFGREIYKRLNVPVGLINSSFGGTPAEAWTRREILENNDDLKRYPERDAIIEKQRGKYERRYDQMLEQWQKDVNAAQASGAKPPKKPRGPQELEEKFKCSRLYNVMIHPLIPFAIKGVIWYQGEGNVDKAFPYRKLFPAMIKSWREEWKQGDFPFYYVQLASFGVDMKKTPAGLPNLEVPTNSKWAELREGQLMTLSLPNTGMAVAMDVGEIDTIHPKNKQDVGKRLALWALAKTYGFKNIVYSGPLYKKMEIEGDKARIFFEQTGSGLMVKGNSLKGFAIAGADEKFVWADAKIDGDTVLVWSKQVKNPTAVRYGWADWIDCNLYNKEGLPAATFRTDNFPAMTK